MSETPETLAQLHLTFIDRSAGCMINGFEGHKSRWLAEANSYLTQQLSLPTKQALTEAIAKVEGTQTKANTMAIPYLDPIRVRNYELYSGSKELAESMISSKQLSTDAVIEALKASQADRTKSVAQAQVKHSADRIADLKKTARGVFQATNRT